LKRLAILASGSGFQCRKNHGIFPKTLKKPEIALVASNRADALVLERAKKFEVPTFHLQPKGNGSRDIVGKLQAEKIDWVILAGFL